MYSDFLEVVGLLFWLIVLVGICVGAGAILYLLIIRLWVFTEERMIAIESQRLAVLRQRKDVEVMVMTPSTLPVPRTALDSLNVGAAYAALLDAVKGHPAGLQSLTYSPNLRYNNETQGLLPEQASTVPLVVPDFWQLYHAGQLPEHGFLLGFNPATGSPITADWRELYSALVGGSSGSGKSTLIRNILAQSALQGGRFVVLDKHYGAGDDSLGASLAPLRPLMLTDIASTESQMLDALSYVRNVAEARLSGGDKDRTPIVLVIDETTGLLLRSNVATSLIDVLGIITQESRKAGVFAFAIGQQWSSQVLSTNVRNSFVSALSCRARRDVARTMSGSTEFGQIVEALPQYHAAWLRPDGEIVKLAIPNTTQKHIDLVARTLTPDKTPVYALPEVGSGPLSGPQSGPDVTNVAHAGPDTGPDRDSDVALTVDPIKAELIRQLFKAGKPRSAILREVWGINAKPGDRAFKTASRELDEVIRALV
jgi:hypothetical protein